MSTEPKMMSYAVPVNQNYLAVVGSIAIKHTHLDHALRMMIRTLSGISVDEALNATEFDGAKELREQVRKLARKRLGVDVAYIKLKDLLYRCGEATRKRNDLLHSIFGQELDGEMKMRMRDRGWIEIPSFDWLSELHDEIHNLAIEVNTERLHGFIHEALKDRS